MGQQSSSPNIRVANFDTENSKMAKESPTTASGTQIDRSSAAPTTHTQRSVQTVGEVTASLAMDKVSDMVAGMDMGMEVETAVECQLEMEKETDSQMMVEKETESQMVMEKEAESQMVMETDKSEPPASVMPDSLSTLDTVAEEEVSAEEAREAEIVDLMICLQEEKSSKDALEATISGLEQSLEEIKKDLSDTKSCLAAAELEKQDLLFETEKLYHAQSDLQHSNFHIQQLQDKIAGLAESVTNLQGQLDEAHSELAKSKEGADGLTEQISGVREELERTTLELVKVREQKEKIDKERAGVCTALEEKTTALAEVQSENELLKQQKEETDEDRARVRADLERERAVSGQLQVWEAEVRSENESLKQKMNKRGQESTRLSEALEESTAALEQLRLKETEVRTENEELAGTHAKAEAESATLRTRLEETQLALEQTKTRLEDSQCQLTKATQSPWGQFVVICVDLSGSLSRDLDQVLSTYLAILSTLKARSPSAIVAVVTHGPGEPKVIAQPTRIHETAKFSMLESALDIRSCGGTECYGVALPIIRNLLDSFKIISEDRRVILIGDGNADDNRRDLVRDFGAPIHSLVIGRSGSWNTTDSDEFSNVTHGYVCALEDGADTSEAINKVLFE